MIVVSVATRSVLLAPVKTVSHETGHTPARHEGPFPVWDHSYTQAEAEAMKIGGNGNVVRATLRKDGKWYIANTKTRVTFGEARYYRDYSY